MVKKKGMKFEFEHQMEIYKDLIKKGEENEQAYQLEQALNIYINARKIIKKYGSKIENGNIFHRIGRVFAQRGNLKDALDAFKESIKLIKKGGGTALQIADVKGAMGEAYKINGKEVEALNMYQNALKILREEKERVVYTHSHLTIQIFEAITKQLNNIGELYLLLGDSNKALEYYQECLKINLDTQIPSIILKTRLVLSKIYAKNNDNKTALEYLLKSIDIAKKENDQINLLDIYLKIAGIYKNEKNGRLALNFYKKALKLSEKLENRLKMTEILDEIGIMYLEKYSITKALEFFKKSYNIGNEINQYYFDYILYHLGLLYYLNKNYDSAYENLRDSLKFAEKNNNKALLIKILIMIGNIWRNRDNLEDSIYYYKRALKYTRNLKIQIEILNKIGLSNLLFNKLQDAYNYFLKSFNWLRIIIMLESNYRKKQQIIEKFSEIPQNLCAIECVLYEKTKNIEPLKMAIGYSEFLRSLNSYNNIKNNLNKNESSDRKKIQIVINEKCLKLKKLNRNYQLEKVPKLKEKLLNQIEEIQEKIFQLDENLWEMRNGEIYSFPKIVEKIINKFFKIFTHISDSWGVLDFVYIKNLNKLYIFLIDIKKKELYLFSKQLNERFVNSVQNKLKLLESRKIEDDQIKNEKILASVNNLWGKLVPKPLNNFLNRENYKSLTIIPHSFLWKLPWANLVPKSFHLIKQVPSLFSVKKEKKKKKKR
ncbi:MAG: tetratricopeptide repeat protein [Promethearchaeota archaeon]